MKNMTLEQIAHAIDGQLFIEQEDNRVAQGVVIDNRLIKQDYIFVAIAGNKVDGHSFVNGAYETGALGAIVEKDGDYNGPYILVDSTEDALRALATYYRMQLDIPIIGIIGSVGKTSTKEMVASVLSQKYNVLKTQGNLNNNIGLPLTLLSIKEEHEVAVVEMGISDFGEMDELGTIAKPDIVAYTNIGQCHLENLIDRAGVLKAKTEVFKHLNKNAIVVYNLGDDMLEKIPTQIREAKLDDLSVVSYSAIDAPSGKCADVQAVDVKNLGLEGMRATITGGKVEADVIIPLPGEHNVSNAMCAAAVGNILGESTNEIVDGIAAASTIAGRSNFIEVKGVTIIDDCYNANPVSMRASLQVLGMSKGRKIAVLGDMGELGADEVELHRNLCTSVLDNKIDVLYTVGDLSKAIVEALENSVVSATAFASKNELLEVLLPEVNTGDTILVKASHFMEFPEIVNKIKEKLED